MNKAVFEYSLCEKRAHTKLNDVPYLSFKLQPYLATKTLNNKSKDLYTISGQYVTHPKITSGR